MIQNQKPLLAGFTLAATGLAVLNSAAAAKLGDAVSLYASFDESAQADFGGGDLKLRTRVNHPTDEGKYIFERGYPPLVFQIAKDKGVSGGALDCTDVLDRRGRIFFPARGNIAFRDGGWGGAVSMWLNTDPNQLLQTPFCDPVQITDKSAHDGGIWIDFPDTEPRDMRMGIFTALAAGQQPLKESDPQAAIVRMTSVPFKTGRWHHVVLSWHNFDTGKPDARAELFVDGKRVGQLADREIAMRWDLGRAGIYVAVNFIGLFDEFAVFKRPLTAAEVQHLYREPACLSKLRRPNHEDRKIDATSGLFPRENSLLGSDPPSAPRFPFGDETAQKYRRAFAAWANLPVEFTAPAGISMQLIPPGTFLMGSSTDEPGREGDGRDETRHRVTLTRPFYLAAHEVTVGQFQEFVSATGYVTDGERNGGGHAHDGHAVWKHRPGTSWRRPGYAGPFVLLDTLPVVHVSHNDAVAFCQWLDRKAGFATADGFRFGLPTEPQWEWACRAGSGDRFWWGDEVDESGRRLNVGDRFLKRVHPRWPRETMPMNDGRAFPAPVGSYEANAFGLHDVLGNVWEFCSTRYGPYPTEAVVDPGHLDPKRGYAVRGGGWSNEPRDARCATRNADPPTFCHSNLGFRIALELQP